MKRNSTEATVRKARLMRGKGITYDSGFFNAGVSTHEPFDPEVVKREMRVIHDDLYCNAVRITGGNADRLEIAAMYAADASLEVWFSPFTCDLTTDELLDFLADCAERAERLRRQGAEVIFVTGAELSLFTVGFLPGDTLKDRLDLLAVPHRLRELLPQVPPRINDFLGKAAARVRERFGGKISYASIPFEGVDWTLFDFISVDAYRSIAVANRYRDGIRALVAQGKPVAITEFGCATFQGAADKGGSSGMIVEYDNTTPIRLDGDYIRDEAEQATCLRDLLDIFTAEGVDTAFANTFASYHLPHRRDPRTDLDMASYGVVKVFEDRLGRSYADMAWEPKAAFTALADYYHG
jgi:hypothetical protein